MKVLVTGATGFVGHALVTHLRAQGFEVVAASRKGEGAGEIAIGDIGPDTQWQAALAGCHAVVHAAARVHRMEENALAGLEQARRVNCAGSIELARQAAHCGVRRFIFISSVKVNGEAGHFGADSACAPDDAYGISKHEAELGLTELAEQTGMQLFVLRLPLVYGPGVGANFLRLMSAVERGLPLPLGRIGNRRSLLYLGNLVDAIRACLQTPLKGTHIWHLSDGEDVSTPNLVRGLARAMGRQARLLPVPVWLLSIAAAALGRAQAAQRLTGSLTVDSTSLQAELGWRPPYSLAQGLQRTADWYFKRDRNT